MAGESEVERLVVRLTGDGASYRQMLQQAQSATRTFQETQRSAERVIRRVESASASFGRQVGELRGLLQQGAISQDVYNKAMRQAETDFRRANDNLKRFSGNLKSVGMQLTITGAAITAAFGGIATMALRSAGKFEQTTIAFETMLGSVSATTSLLSDLTDFAAKTPFEMPEILQAARGLVQFGERGKSLMKTLEMLGNAASGTSTPFGFLALVFNQVRGVGKLLTQDFRQLSTRGVLSLEDIRKHFNTTLEGAQEMLSTGKISFQDLRDILEGLSAEGGRFNNLMERQSKSLLGLWSTLTDEVGIMAREFGENFMPAAKKAVEWILKMVGALRDLDPGTKGMIGDLVMAAATIGAVVTAMGTATLAAGALAAAIGAVRESYITLSIIEKVTSWLKGLTTAATAASAAQTAMSHSAKAMTAAQLAHTGATVAAGEAAGHAAQATHGLAETYYQMAVADKAAHYVSGLKKSVVGATAATEGATAGAVMLNRAYFGGAAAATANAAAQTGLSVAVGQVAAAETAAAVASTGFFAKLGHAGSRLFPTFIAGIGAVISGIRNFSLTATLAALKAGIAAAATRAWALANAFLSSTLGMVTVAAAAFIAIFLAVKKANETWWDIGGAKSYNDQVERGKRIMKELDELMSKRRRLEIEGLGGIFELKDGVEELSDKINILKDATKQAMEIEIKIEGAKQAAAGMENTLVAAKEARDKLNTFWARWGLWNAKVLDDANKDYKTAEENAKKAQQHVADLTALLEQLEGKTGAKGLEQLEGNLTKMTNEMKMAVKTMGMTKQQAAIFEAEEQLRVAKEAGRTDEELAKFRELIQGLKDVGKAYDTAKGSQRFVDSTNKATEALEREAKSMFLTGNQRKLWELGLQAVATNTIEAHQAVARYADALKVYEKAQKEAADNKKLQDSIKQAGKQFDDYINRLTDQVAVLKLQQGGMDEAGVEAQIYAMQMSRARAGVAALTTEQIEQIRALGRQFTAQKKTNDLWEKGKALVEKYKSPMEKFKERQKELAKMLEIGAIGINEYQQALLDARKEAGVDITTKFKVEGIEAVEFGSKEALKHIQDYLAKVASMKNPKLPEAEPQLPKVPDLLQLPGLPAAKPPGMVAKPEMGPALPPGMKQAPEVKTPKIARLEAAEKAYQDRIKGIKEQFDKDLSFDRRRTLRRSLGAANEGLRRNREMLEEARKAMPKVPRGLVADEASRRLIRGAGDVAPEVPKTKRLIGPPVPTARPEEVVIKSPVPKTGEAVERRGDEASRDKVFAAMVSHLKRLVEIGEEGMDRPGRRRPIIRIEPSNLSGST